jgi:nicotinamide mononucleotide transporter
VIISVWLLDNYVELFGAIAGIVYVFLEIRQTIWLWPVGIVTSAVYILVFFTGKLYADMSLQVYYLVISFLGWWWWTRGKNGKTGEGDNVRNGEKEKKALQVTRINLRTVLITAIVFVVLYALMRFILSRFTDSPVPGWDSFITSLSIVATWMLARKIYEHWLLWIVVNFTAAVLFYTRGLFPTVILYLVYGIMSFAGLVAWNKTIIKDI